MKEQIKEQIKADKTGLKEQIIADKKSGLKMFSTRYFRFLIVAAAALAACTDDPVDPAEGTVTDPVEDAEPASLTINFSIADLGIDVSTRAGMGNWGGTRASGNAETRATGTPGTLCGPLDKSKADMLNPDNPWPELYPVEDAEGKEITLTAEKYKHNYDVAEAALVDGSMLTCLTVILVNYKENKIVAVRRIPDPDCPNHNVKYRDGIQSYPPPPGPEREKAKKNCILVKKADGTFDLAPVLRDENGAVVVDNPEDKHIAGLVGTHACVTFEYENPIHVVKSDEIYDSEGKLKPGYDENDRQYVGKSTERLVRGEYTLLVIANYDHSVTTASRQGNLDGSDTEKYPTLNVDTELEKLANEFHLIEHRAEGIPDFRSRYQYLYDLRFLMNRTLEGVKTNVDGQPSTVTYNVVDLPVTDKDGNPLKPYIRPAVHQTLTAAKDIYLEAGDNVIDVELQRIASRTRVEVKNYSEDQRLKVHSLEFSKNYTQSTTYLFRRNKVDRDYSELASIVTGKYDDHDGKGAPRVDYTGIYNLINGEPTYGAIVPFIKNPADDGIIVESVSNGNNKQCIFDALMYESHLDYKDEEDDPDSFYYTIDVSYPDITLADNYVAEINKIDQDNRYEFVRYDDTKISYDYAIDNNDHYIKPTTDIKSSVYDKIAEIEDKLNKDEKNQPLKKGESLCFLIQGINSSKYLYEKEDGTLYAEFTSVDPKSEGIDMESYLWVLEKDNTDNYCYLKNVRSGKYLPEIPNPQDDKVVYMTSIVKDENKKFNFGLSDLNYDGSGHTGTYNITFSRHFDEPYTYKEKTYSDCYLSVWAGGPNLSGYSIADQGCQYRLYPIIRTRAAFYKGTPRMKKKIELTTFSDKTGYVEKVREIKRNDFIRILVEVSYNTKTNDFQFLVNDWDDKKGGVEFN